MIEFQTLPPELMVNILKFAMKLFKDQDNFEALNQGFISENTF